MNGGTTTARRSGRPTTSTRSTSPTTRSISASRRVEAPSRHRRDSSPGEEVVGGLWSKFEPIRTASRPRCSAQVTDDENTEETEEREVESVLQWVEYDREEVGAH